MEAYSKRLIDNEKAIIFGALAGGLLMWCGHGLLKGFMFFLVIFLVPQPVYIYEYWRERKKTR